MSSSYLGNQNIPTNDIFVPPLELVQSGLVFDFRAQDYQSGSLTWNAYVGNYTASITGTVGGGLNYIGGNKVGFNGNQWLKFSDNMTGSISSSQWQVYALVAMTGQQTSSQAYIPEFFSKGSGTTPSWAYGYHGGSPFPQNAGWGLVDGGSDNNGLTTDTLNRFMTGSSQLIAFTMFSGSPWPNYTQTGSVSINNFTGQVGSTILYSETSINTSFTGSAPDPLLFGKGVNPGATNISGSVIRMFAYNRILNSTERKYNWNILQYPI